MNKDNEYRRMAHEAQALADRSKNENDRAAWLRIARGWLDLIQSKHVTAEDRFEEADCGSQR